MSSSSSPGNISLCLFLGICSQHLVGNLFSGEELGRKSLIGGKFSGEIFLIKKVFPVKIGNSFLYQSMSWKC